jgi:hypothetical protein
MTPFGAVTFTTKITAEDTSPCGPNSQWVRATRTIRTHKGDLVLHQAGLQCPQSDGPIVDMVWAVDSTNSSGEFAGATGRGYDIANPVKNTATPHGTITLTSSSGSAQTAHSRTVRARDAVLDPVTGEMHGG